MLRPFLIGISLILSLQHLLSQTISYEFDTSGMYFINHSEGDTVLHVQNKMKSQVNFRIQKNESLGHIKLKALNNPGIDMFDQNGNYNVQISSKINSSGGGILLSDIDNGKNQVIRLVTNYQNTGQARIITEELQINGGSDLAELFEITNEEKEISPGLLVSLDPNKPGKLMISNQAYDKKIAGIISGANGIKPGILMGQDETIASGDQLITLSGRTYIKANNSNGPIKIGDLITSSKIPGEGMRTKSNRKSRGAVIGKAMTELNKTSGYILVLVNLQ